MTSANGEAGASEHSNIQPNKFRDWWPDAYLDETMPVGRSTPNAWLCSLDDGAPAYGIPGDEDYPPKAIREGDVVAFAFCDRLGHAILSFNEDGSPIWSPPIPTYVNHLWDGDEIIGDNAAEFAEWIRESEGSDTETVVRLSHWHTREIIFLFANDGDNPSFLPMAPVPGLTGEPIEPPADPQAELFATTSLPTPEA